MIGGLFGRVVSYVGGESAVRWAITDPPADGVSLRDLVDPCKMDVGYCKPGPA